LLMDPAWNRVSISTGKRRPTSRQPNPCAHAIYPWSMTAMEQLGIPSSRIA
jgi:hypothetical protein